MPSPEKFQFAVDSALLSELGEKLVTTVHVALTELVKNAYDADATRVSVQILPEMTGAPRVIVEDDGVGMTLRQVRDYWMKIGTSNKVQQPETAKFGRLKTGSKGVGRFACRRLGLKLKLKTTAKTQLPGSGAENYQTTRIEFDWPQFTPGVDVESIISAGETETATSGKAGTTLEISGGENDEWQGRGFDYLQRQLALLASNRGAARPGYEQDPGFNVVLEAPQFSGSPIDLREELINASWGTLTATVDKEGRATCSLTAKGLGGTKRFTSKERFNRIAGATLRVGVLPAMKDEARKPELLASYVLSDLINEWGGIHLRFNGFRMFPYGDPGDDWLRIDADRGRRLGKPSGELFDFAASLDRIDAGRVLLNMLGMRNYLGQIDVTSNIAGLTPRIDRQGFIENEVFEEIRRFARFAIEWAIIHRDHYIRLREHEEANKAREAIKSVLNLDVPKEQVVPKAASYLRSEIKRIVRRLPPTQQKETEQTLVRTVKAIETASTESYKQLEHLRLIASASTLTLLFAHEVRTVIGSLGGASLRLEQLAAEVPGHSQELISLGTQLKETKDRFDNLVTMTGIVGAFGKTDTLTTLNLKGAIDRATRCFRLVIENYDIAVDDTDVPSDLMIGPMIEGELYTILINLLSNSVKSVIAAGRVSRRIRFEAEQRAKSVAVRVLDNGIGLDREFFEEVFTPFISDPSGALYDRLEERANPEDASIFGTGSGLGLSIARDIAQSRGGNIKFVEPPASWNACVEVELP